MSDNTKLEMDLSELNKLITEHLRHYGFQVAARIVESELRGNKSRIVDKPSKLLGKNRSLGTWETNSTLDLAIRGARGGELNVKREESSLASTNTHDSSVRSGVHRSRNDDVTIESEDYS